jgi:hypothetical protein
MISIDLSFYTLRGNRLIVPAEIKFETSGTVRRRQRLRGLLTKSFQSI